MEPNEDSSSSGSVSRSNSRSSASSRSRSSQSGDWTDEEAGAKQSQQPSPVAASSKAKPERSGAPRKFQKKKDYNRFDRPDMFVNDLFRYAGMYLAPDSSKPPTLPTFPFENKKSRILRISVEGGVVATGAELFGSLQKAILESSDQSILPSTLSLRGQSLRLDYAPPHGDELSLDVHPQDSRWIGNALL